MLRLDYNINIPTQIINFTFPSTSFIFPYLAEATRLPNSSAASGPLPEIIILPSRSTAAQVNMFDNIIVQIFNGVSLIFTYGGDEEKHRGDKRKN